MELQGRSRLAQMGSSYAPLLHVDSVPMERTIPSSWSGAESAFCTRHQIIRGG